jgi:gas vesicle protein
MRRLGKYVVGAMLGGFIGAGLGLLLAPKSGPALRNDITDYTQQVKREVRGAAEQRRVELRQELDRLRVPAPLE